MLESHLNASDKDTYLIKQDIVTLQEKGLLPNLKDREILEIGPGQGFGTRILRELGANVTAIDQDSKRVEVGCTMGHFDNVKLIVGENAAVYLYDKSFDDVFAFHIGPLTGNEASIPQAWKDMLFNGKSHIRRGGKVFLSYHAAEDTDLNDYLDSINVSGKICSRQTPTYYADVFFLGEVGLPDNIYLIGTCHYDLNGYQRLHKILDVIQPACITLEANNFTLSLVRQFQEFKNFDPEIQKNELKKIYNINRISDFALYTFLGNYFFEDITGIEY